MSQDPNPSIPIRDTGIPSSCSTTTPSVHYCLLVHLDASLKNGGSHGKNCLPRKEGTLNDSNPTGLKTSGLIFITLTVRAPRTPNASKSLAMEKSINTTQTWDRRKLQITAGKVELKEKFIWVQKMFDICSFPKYTLCMNLLKNHCVETFKDH